MNHTKLATVVVISLAVGVACESKLTGNEGNFQFSYTADDALLDFNKPLAVGARLDMSVRDIETDTPVDLTDASLQDGAIMEVVSFNGDTVVLQAASAGNTLLNVEGTNANGDLLTDSVNVRAAVPEIHELNHTCTGQRSAAYLAGQDIYVPFEFKMDNASKEPVIGYGYYPVTLSASEPMALDSSWTGAQFMRFETAAAGAVTVTSDIDGTTLDLEIIDEADIDGVEEPTAWVFEDIDVGDTNPFFVRPMSDDLVVCQATASIQVVSDTPSICSVEVTGDDLASGDSEYEYGWFEVTGVAEGTCQYTVTYPGGTGASAQFTYPIEP